MIRLRPHSVGEVAVGEVGTYRLDTLLGRGGTGEVYRAHDTRKRDRVVALRLLPARLSNEWGSDDAFVIRRLVSGSAGGRWVPRAS